MIPLLLAALLALGPAAGSPPQARGRVIDAVRAAVNSQAITDSDVRQAAWYSRLVGDLHHDPGGPRAAPPPLTAGQRRRALDHLISEALLAQARRQGGVGGRPPAPALRAAVDQQLKRMQTLAGGVAAWPAVLRRYHLSAAAVRAILTRQLQLLLFADAHCRPQVRVRPTDVAAYYRQTFLPLARQGHIRPAPLAAVAPDIRAILIQRQLLHIELQWIARLRARARVQVFPSP